MITIFEYLNKIQWDKNLNKDSITLHYYDRIKKCLLTLRFNDVKDYDKQFLILNNDVNVPLHRIMEIKSNNKLLWSRKKC